MRVFLSFCTAMCVILTWTELSAQIRRPVGRNVQKVEVNELEVPYISTYWIEPFVSPKDDVKFKFYVTDWNQSEYRLCDDSFTFDAHIECELLSASDPKAKNKPKPKIVSLKKIKAGDHEVNLGKLPEGEYSLSLKAVDMYGRRSNVLFNEFIVRVPEKAAIPEKETYRMTEADLSKYGISNKGDYGTLKIIEIPETERAGAEGLIQNEAEYTKTEPGRYTIVATGMNGIPDMGNWKKCRVLYAPDYDHAKVELESVSAAAGLNRLLKDVAGKGFRKMVMLPGVYRISATATIEIPTRFTLDMNGSTLKLNEFTGCGAVMMRIADCFDSHVVNGIVEGDYFEHDYAGSEKNSEWVCGIEISGESKYSSFEDMTVRYITGYGVMNGFKGSAVQPRGAGKFVSGGIDFKTGELDIEKDGVSSSEYIDISSFVPTRYLAVSKYLGYQGMATGSWYFTAYFYNAEKEYIEGIDAFQYRIIKIPDGAKYMRLTVVGSEPEKIPEMGLTLTHFNLPWNCWFKGLKISNARCVGMAQAAMRNFLVENCEFTRSGESGAFCAYDAEDGWDMMQDITIRGNKFYQNHRNDFLTCAGHNFIVENNEGRIHIWDRTKSYVIRNNRFKDGTFLSGNRNRTMLPRIDNNTFENGVRLGGDSKDWYIVMQGPVQAKSISCGTGGVLANVELDGGDYFRLGCINSTIRNAKVGFAGSRFIKCKLENISGHTNGAVLIDNCDVKDIESGIFQPSDIVIKNSRLENVTYKYAYWTKPGNFTIENSTVKNADKPLISTPVYSIGGFNIVKCIADTGASPLIQIYDMRPQQDTDKENGTVTITETKIENKVNTVVGVSGDKSTKTLIFYNVKNIVDNAVRFADAGKWPENWQILTALPKVEKPKAEVKKTPPRETVKKETKTTEKPAKTKKQKKTDRKKKK